MPFDTQTLPRVRITGLTGSSVDAETAASLVHSIDYARLGSWHLERTGEVGQPLMRALVVAHAIAPHLDHLAQKLLPRMQRKPRAARELGVVSAGPVSQQMLLGDAIRCPWMTVDGTSFANCIVLHMTHDRALELTAKLPESIRPTVLIDPATGDAQAIVQLKTPVTRTDKASKEALGTLWLAGALMAEALNATLLKPGSLVRSAWGQVDGKLRWTTIPGAVDVELRDIIRYLRPVYGNLVGSPAKPATQDSKGARKALRRPRAACANEGVMELSSLAGELSTSERQGMAAKRTAMLKSQATAKKLLLALMMWPDRLQVTQQALSERTGISSATVRRHWNQRRDGVLQLSPEELRELATTMRVTLPAAAAGWRQTCEITLAEMAAQCNGWTNLARAFDEYAARYEAAETIKELRAIGWPRVSNTLMREAPRFVRLAFRNMPSSRRWAKALQPTSPTSKTTAVSNCAMVVNGISVPANDACAAANENALCVAAA